MPFWPTFLRPGADGGVKGLTADKMKECRWVAPVLVGLFEFLEWTPDGHLRHARFRGLSEHREAREVPQ